MATASFVPVSVLELWKLARCADPGALGRLEALELLRGSLVLARVLAVLRGVVAVPGGRARALRVRVQSP